MARLKPHTIKLLGRDEAGTETPIGDVEFTPRIAGLAEPGEIELRGDFEGGALVPPNIVDQLLEMFYGAYPFPQVFELQLGSTAAAQMGAEPISMCDANAVCGMLWEWGRQVGEMERQLEQLRAERLPFKVVMDRALECAIGEKRAPSEVLELAERLGFRKPELPPLGTSSTFMLDHLGEPRCARVVNVRAPLRLPPGVALVRLEVIGNNDPPCPCDAGDCRHCGACIAEPGEPCACRRRQ